MRTWRQKRTCRWRTNRDHRICLIQIGRNSVVRVEYMACAVLLETVGHMMRLYMKALGDATPDRLVLRAVNK